ncbi:MAG TPA: DUF4157 domain-containing protein [Kofleriaceae bacterium]|nr:DUF4157 domain-containing protein [Kofleriaceae bacterium]
MRRTMDSGYGEGSAKQGDRTGRRGTDSGSEPLGVGKVSRIQLRFGPHAPQQPSEPGKRTLTEQLVPIQAQRAEPGSATTAGPPPTGGGGTPLPADVRAQMEAALGANFAAVRVHVSPYAAVIGAHAFTRGTDLFFAPGAYDPTSPQGLQLLGHELVHVIQQAQGRVPVNASIGGAPANTDASLEQEADELGAKAAKPHGGAAPTHSFAPTAPPGHGPVQRKAAPDADQGAVPAGPHIDELEPADAATAATDVAPGPPIQRDAPRPTKREYVSFRIAVSREMTGEEFKTAANLQVFGVASVRSEWKHVKDHYGPGDSPVEVGVELSLLQRMRGAAAASKGIDVDDHGQVAGADARAKDFLAQPGSDEKSALLNEIDRRYHAATGTPDGAQIKPGETANAALWNSIRDEVLFQHAYIASLPDSVKRLIRVTIKGRQLTPPDYDQLFRIAKKIEGMPPGQAADYASKVTASTTSLDELDASIDRYLGEMATRKQDAGEHNLAMTKLAGLEEVYKRFRLWQTLEAVSPGAGDEIKTELEASLKAHGFRGGIPEFDAYVKKFLAGFETESARMVGDLLQKYAGRMYREGERYQDPKEVSALHAKLGGVRTSYAIVQDKNKIMDEEHHKQDAARERSRLPGQGGTTPQPTPRFKQAEQEAIAARDAAKAQIKGLEHDYPIFQNDDALPPDKRIDKVALATASETSLQGVLLGHVAKRGEAISEARGELDGKSELVYRMDKLIPQFYAQQGIQPGSIHDQIIQDKRKEDRIQKIVVGILLAIVAIALTVVSLGTATPALVAAGAAAGAFGISAYQAYEEYKEYTENQKLADVGLVDDPSVVWLVIAVVGAAADMGAAFKAIKGLGAAAKALNAGGEISRFNRAVRALEEAGEIDARIARAAERAAAARRGFSDASGELTKILAGRAYSFPGPFTDPDVYKQLVKMASAKFKEIGNNGLIWLEELKRARVVAKLGEMSPEELAKAKQAWEEGIRTADDAARELAPGADKIAELKKSLTPVLPHAGDVSGPSLVMLDKLDKSVLPRLKAADAAELERLGKMLVEDPSLAERLAKANNPYGALKKAKNVREMDNALFTGRLGELKVNAVRIGPAADRSGIPAAELAKLTDADLKALGEGDRLIAEARQGFGPSEAELGKLASAQAEFDKVSGVANGTRDELRAAIAHQHGLSDLPFMHNPGEALAAKFPDIPKGSMDALVKRHPDALRALENASKQDVEAVVKAFESSANPKDVEDILRSYMYKAQKKARKGVTSGLEVSDDVGGRLEESLDNLAQARKQGHPFGFKDKTQYKQFMTTVDSEVASRGIKGKAKVQGSAMHSRTPGDIDIVVDQAEFGRLSEQFLKNARDQRARNALKVSIKKNKIPSYEFYPHDDPSVANAVKKFTQGADGKELEVQATLIVKGSDFDLGPFL